MFRYEHLTKNSGRSEEELEQAWEEYKRLF